MTRDDVILQSLSELRQDFRTLRAEVLANNARIDKHAQYWAIAFFVGKAVVAVTTLASLAWAGFISYLRVS